jgi:hypothetical protein
VKHSLRKARKIQALSESWVQVLSQELSRKHAHIPCKFHRLETNDMILIRIHSDLLRRRFQINTMSGMGYQYKSIFDAVRVIVKHEGVKGLYKGIAPNLLKVAPSMASSWLSFELTRDFFVGLRPEV